MKSIRSRSCRPLCTGSVIEGAVDTMTECGSHPAHNQPTWAPSCVVHSNQCSNGRSKGMPCRMTEAMHPSKHLEYNCVVGIQLEQSGVEMISEEGKAATTHQDSRTQAVQIIRLCVSLCKRSARARLSGVSVRQAVGYPVY